MKRQSYLAPTRRLPKAPLPFNLPSLRREAGGDGAGGGIAGAGAKWASPRAETVEETREEEKHEERSAATKTAWGGAGLRTRTQPDFPELARPAAAPLSITAKKPKKPDDAKSDKDIENAPETADAKDSSVASTTTKTPEEEDDWAEDDDGMDFTEEAALPEVMIPDVPPPPTRAIQPPLPSSANAPPRVFPGHGTQRRSNVPPPAAHWAQAIKLQQMDRLNDSRTRYVPRPRDSERPHFAHPRSIDVDLKLLEEQKDIMKSKAEMAQEARRKAEAERERIQKERAAKKLRELEERLRLNEERQRPGPSPMPQKTISDVGMSSSRMPRPVSLSAKPSQNVDISNAGSNVHPSSSVSDRDNSHPVVLQRPREEYVQPRSRLNRGRMVPQHIRAPVRQGSYSQENESGDLAQRRFPRSTGTIQAPMSAAHPRSDPRKQYPITSRSSSNIPDTSTTESRLGGEKQYQDAQSQHTSATLPRRDRNSVRPVESHAYNHEMSRGNLSRVGSGRSSRYVPHEGRSRDFNSYERRRRQYVQRADYDGPAENESREEWLERRRKKTETRDAVRSVIEQIISRAVGGDLRNGRHVYARRAVTQAPGLRYNREHSKRDSPDYTKPPSSTVVRGNRPASRPTNVMSSQGKPTSSISSVDSHPSTIETPPQAAQTVRPVLNDGVNKDVDALSTTPGIAPAQPEATSSILFPQETPRHAPQRRAAPPPLRLAPWAPKPNDMKKYLNKVSPVTAQIRAEAEKQAAKMQRPARPGQVSGSLGLPGSSTSETSTSSQTGRNFALENTKKQPETLHQDSSSVSRLREKRSSQLNANRASQIMTSPQSSVNAISAVNHFQNDDLTIPSALGGNVTVLLKHNSRRDPDKEGQGYVIAAPDQKGGIASSSTRIFSANASRGRATRRGRGGRNDPGRRGDRREHLGRSDEMVTTNDSETVMRDLSEKNVQNGTDESLKKRYSEDDGEESRAWAKSNGPSPPTSFDAITRAFSNQPAAFQLVGAPLLPSVPILSVLGSSGAASSSSSYANAQKAWSQNKTWSTSRREPEATTSPWWKSRQKHTTANVNVEHRDPTYQEIVPPTEHEDGFVVDNKTNLSLEAPMHDSVRQNRLEKSEGGSKPRLRKANRNSRRPKRPLVGDSGGALHQSSGSKTPIATSYSANSVPQSTNVEVVDQKELTSGAQTTSKFTGPSDLLSDPAPAVPHLPRAAETDVVLQRDDVSQQEVTNTEGEVAEIVSRTERSLPSSYAALDRSIAQPRRGVHSYEHVSGQSNEGFRKGRRQGSRGRRGHHGVHSKAEGQGRNEGQFEALSNLERGLEPENLQSPQANHAATAASERKQGELRHYTTVHIDDSRGDGLKHISLGSGPKDVKTKGVEDSHSARDEDGQDPQSSRSGTRKPDTNSRNDWSASKTSGLALTEAQPTAVNLGSSVGIKEQSTPPNGMPPDHSGSALSNTVIPATEANDSSNMGKDGVKGFAPHMGSRGRGYRRVRGRVRGRGRGRGPRGRGRGGGFPNRHMAENSEPRSHTTNAVDSISKTT